MSKDLINYYLQSLGEDNAIFLANQYGFSFSKEEMGIVLPLIKKNWEMFLNPNAKGCMMRDIESLTSRETSIKVEKLLNLLINNFHL
ncbi:MAG: DUF2624 family protein [Erysipelotrichaceae bacterium]|nr:DUF2624 family protein [Erysipelotrichaceae bacterium]